MDQQVQTHSEQPEQPGTSSFKGGRWTIYVCPVCGFMDPDQYDRANRQRFCPFAARGGGPTDARHPYRGDRDYAPEVEFTPVLVERA